MTTHRIPSSFLSPPTDEQLIEKSVKGLGSIITGAPLVQRLAKLAAVEVKCRAGHTTTLAKIEDLSRCRCSAKWASVNGGEPLLPDEDEPNEQDKPTYLRTVKDDVPTGGRLDGEEILTNPRKARALWTGSR